MKATSILFLLVVVSTTLFEYLVSWSGVTMPLGRSSYFFENFTNNSAFMFDMYYFIAAHVVLQLSALVFSIVAASVYANSFKLELDKWIIAASLYCILKVSVYLLNSISFPKSRFALALSEGLSTAEFAATIIALLIVIFIFAPSMVVACKNLSKVKISRNSIYLSVTSALLVALLVGFIYQGDVEKSENNKKNIILIGIDSVGWPHIEENIASLPVISKLISSGFTWSNAITPLARTFPAWNSVLTGQYPKEHKAVFNLVPIAGVNKDNIVKKLGKVGYTTIYSQDERRFNNINSSFGFDKEVGPKVGAADFIIPLFADHPISNVLLEYKFGQYLFPFIALNRVSSITYSPSRFVASILDETAKARSPMFLATHFCLVHVPFTWADSIGSRSHASALLRLDAQVGELISGLRKQGKLENSIVVLFSDHGESTSTSEYLFYASKDKYEGVKRKEHAEIERLLFSTNNGHGVNVNSRSQYNSFIIFNDFGSGEIPNGQSEVTISLVDLNQAVGSLAGIAKTESRLVSHMKNQGVMQPKEVFLETGLVFSAIRNAEDVNYAELIEEAAHLYHISDKGMVELKEESIPLLSSHKQKAVMFEDWMLIHTQLPPSEKVISVVINKRSGAWTYDLDSSMAFQAPVDKLKALLK